MPGIQLPIGVDMVNPVPADYKYGPYATLAAAKAAIPLVLRFDGLTVKINGLGEYWWLAANLTDAGLIAKTGGGGLSNPVCTLVMQYALAPNVLGPPVNFSAPNGGPGTDIITLGVTEFTRDFANAFDDSGIYNSAVEANYTWFVSPQNTEWNSVYTDAINNGHANIQNVTTRTYSDYATALNSDADTYSLTTPLVMHDLITNKYYLFTFTGWTLSGGNGGGFAYTRTEVIIGAVTCDGAIHFANSSQIENGLVPYYAATANTLSNGNPIASPIKFSPTWTDPTTNQATGTNSTLIGYSQSDNGGTEVFLIGSRTTVAPTAFLLGIVCLGFANNLSGVGNIQGLYIIGDSNTVSHSSFSSMIGEQNQITTNSSRIIIQGLFNIASNSSNSVMIGNNNNMAGVSSAVVIGISMTLPNSSEVQIGISNQGLRANSAGDSSLGLPMTSTINARHHLFGKNAAGRTNRTEPIANVLEDLYGTTINTTNATSTSMISIPIATSTVVMLEANVEFRKTSGAGTGIVGDGNVYKIMVKAKNIAGVVTIGTVQTIFSDISAMPLPTATFQVFGTNVAVQIAGEASNNLTWHTIVKTYS